MHSSTLESLVLIGTAASVDLVAYSPDGDPLALVKISREDAALLVSLAEAMGHVFHATPQAGGRVCIEAAARRRLSPSPRAAGGTP